MVAFQKTSPWILAGKMIETFAIELIQNALTPGLHLTPLYYSIRASSLLPEAVAD